MKKKLFFFDTKLVFFCDITLQSYGCNVPAMCAKEGLQRVFKVLYEPQVHACKFCASILELDCLDVTWEEVLIQNVSAIH